MKKIKDIIKLFVIFILLSTTIIILPVSFNNTVQAADIIVDYNGGGDYTTIQAAINAASNGDIIYIWDGIYTQNVVVNKSVSIIGNGTTNTNVVSPGASANGIFQITSNNVNISYLSFDGINASGVYGIKNTGDNLKIVNCNFSRCKKDGIYTSNTNYTNISNCNFYFTGFNDYRGGVYCYQSENITVDSCNFNHSYPTPISDVSPTGVFIRESNNVLVNNCYFYKILSNYETFGVTCWDYSSNITVKNCNFSSCSGAAEFYNTIDNITFINNEIYASYLGYYTSVYLSGCSDLLFDNNSVFDTKGFIYAEDIGDFIFSNNTIINSSEYNAFLVQSMWYSYLDSIYNKNGVIHNNNISMNTIDYYGIVIAATINVEIYDNTINNAKRGISLYDWDTDITYLNMNIYNNIITNMNQYGLYLESYYGGGNNATINNNTITNCNTGIYIYGKYGYATNISIYNNIITESNYGIYMTKAQNNWIYNNYFNNTINVEDDGTNTWNITKALGTNIIGGPYLGGNFWSDYNGSDTDYDGLGDTNLPYFGAASIDYGGDYHPLSYIPPILTNASAEPNPGYEGDTFYFNVSFKDLDSGDPLEIKCIISYEGTQLYNVTMSWVTGNNYTGANYTYSRIPNNIGVYGYQFKAYDGRYWVETTEQYLLVQGLPGHFDAKLFFNFYDNRSGLGLSPNLLKIYLSNDTTINSDDRIFNPEYNTYTGAIFYYKITDYFDNKIYPQSSNYSTVIINSLHKYVDIPIDWFDFAVKNLNESIMHFSMKNGSRYYNRTLFYMDSEHFNVLPGNYQIIKKYYSPINGTLLRTLYDNITIYDDRFYIATGYDALVHISWYNTNEGLGLPSETLKIYMNGVRQTSMEYWTYINRTINLTIKDYYNFTMYTGNFTLVTSYTYLDLGLTFHSWLFGNKNEKYYMISFLKDGATRWYERGIVPYGEREFLLPSGNYTMRIYDSNWTELHNQSYTVNRSMVYVIEGYNLSAIIYGQSVITGQLLELRDEFRVAIMPDLINIACNLPYIYSIFDTKGAIIGTTLVCPYLVVTATTTNQTITNCTMYPLIPETSVSNGTILIRDDILFFEGNNTAWVNISTIDGTLIQNTSYRPNKLVLSGQNITVTSAQPITVTRETTYQQQKKFSWTKYTDTLFYTATINVNNLLNSTIKQIYVYIELANDTTPNIATARCYDVTNGLYLTSGTNFRVSNGIEFMLDSMAANTTRQFTCSYFGMPESKISSDAIIIVDDYNLRMYNNKNYWHLYGQWVNTGSTTFIGNLFIQFNFDTVLSDGTKLVCSPRSFVVYDNENSRYLDRDEYVYLGNGLQISQDSIGSVNPNSARSFDVYFLFVEAEEETDIPQEAKNWFKTSFYGQIEYFHIIMLILGIIAVACADVAYGKRKTAKSFKKEAWIAFIIGFIMFILWIWYTKL